MIPNLDEPTVKVECPLTEDEAQDLIDGTRNITFHHKNIEIEVLSPLLQDESIDEAVARHQEETEEA